MATTVPVTFRASPLPSNFLGTPQQFLDALVARLSIESPSNTIAIITTGSVLPTSDVGPFLLNGQTWYVWDVGTGAYIPQVVGSETLKYIAQNATPDHTKYIFWIYLDGSGKAQDIRYYSGGAWHSIFEDYFATLATTSAMNTAIAAAIAGIPAAVSSYPFRAQKGVTQAISFGPGSTTNQVTFDVKVIDPDNVFGSNKLTVPADRGGAWLIGCSLEFGVTSGTPTQTDFGVNILVNGVPECSFILPIDSTDDRTYNISSLLSLAAGDEVTVEFTGTVDGACTVTIGNDPDTNFWGHLVKVI